MTADKAVYKCPKCDYRTHFPKALEAHMKFRKHFVPHIIGSQGQEFIVPANTPINVVINGESVDEKVIKEAIEEAVESTVKAEKKTKTVKRPRKKAEKE